MANWIHYWKQSFPWFRTSILGFLGSAESLWWVTSKSEKPKLFPLMSAKKWAINCVHRWSGSWDIPLSAAKIGFAIWKCMETAILTLGEELQGIVFYQKCSPECQLKLEPSTASIGCQILEIFHFSWQKLMTWLLKLYGNGYFCSGWRITRDSIVIVFS